MSSSRYRCGLTALLVIAPFALVFPHAASAFNECGNPRGPARNVTAVKVSCPDARAFARKLARRGVTRSGHITLAGWHTYRTTVRRVGRKYDVRATRGAKVIRFQYRRHHTGAGSAC